MGLTHTLCPGLGALLQLVQQSVSFFRVGEQMDVYTLAQWLIGTGALKLTVESQDQRTPVLALVTQCHFLELVQSSFYIQCGTG